VHVAPPARRKHIAHYICLDKAEREFGGDVLQNDNAGGDENTAAPVVGADGVCAIGQCIGAL
jgi:hypothetical protein